jgi:iron complex transport system substrate-binding protein
MRKYIGIHRQSAILLLFIISLSFSYGQHRVVSLSPTLTEIVYTLDAGDYIVGCTTFCDTPAKVTEDRNSGKMKVVSDFTHTNYALIDSLKPDLILTDTDFQKKITAELRAKGYKVLHFVPTSLEEVFKSIEDVGDAIGKGELARQQTDGYRKEINELYAKTSKLPKVRVYMEINHIGPWAVGKRSPLNDLMIYAGGENIYGDVEKGVFMTSNGDIVTKNPDVILSPIWKKAKLGGYDGITPLGEIYGRKDFDKIKAVQDSRVLYYDSALLKHEGPRQVLAIRKLAFLLHPEACENPDGTIPWELGRIIY